MSLTRKIDHIVYAAPDIESGIRSIQDKLGITAVYGGRHLYQGTHNAIIKMGNGCYFEIIAPDPENKTVASPRWMGVDLVKTPRITRWAIKSSDIKDDLQHLTNANPVLGFSKEGQRVISSQNILTWELSIPLGEPLVEPIPFLIDWKDSTHPSEGLEDLCQMKSLSICSKEPEALKKLSKALNLNQEVIAGSENQIRLTVNCPMGKVTIW